MFEKFKRVIKTLAFRLTVTYAAIFTLSAVAALLVSYLMTSAVLLENLDEELLEDVEDLSELVAPGKTEPLLEELQSEAEEEDPETFFFRLLSPDGKEILTSDLEDWEGLESATAVKSSIDSSAGVTLKTLELPDQESKTRVAYARLAEGYYLQLGEALEENDEILEIIVGIFARTLLLILLLAAITGWLMARRALSGVEEVTLTARRITKGDFSQRVPVKSRGHEIERLATTFNYMLDRIHALITGIREVTDNIAHDLRSPITSVRGTAETTLMMAENIDDYKAMAGNTIEECDRLLGMINAMLDLSEADAGADKLEVCEVDVTQVVKQACELFQPLAEEKHLAMILQAPTTCTTLGDTKKIQRLVANLLDNALKYTPAGGKVNVSVSCDDVKVEIAVNDNGVGIAGHDLPYIFQRFYRCDKSRSEEGTGLGLSLALAIAKAHGGNIEVQSEIDKGTSFVVTMSKTLAA